ncbi:MAG TPA: ATP-grasp domain-containing protein, partial [Longimicrobiales bacterium]|nr:ATP-grasp domain-containing protein [Longimicrobiales bacterium]
TTILALSSYEKGNDFLRQSAASGARTFLLTVEKLRDAPWPRELLADVFLLPTFDEHAHVVNAVSYLARSEKIDRIVALDEFDMELAALLREHLRIPGMSVTTTRGVRDKLAMRDIAAAAGIRVPPFVGVINHATVADFMESVPAPWLLKPRTQASAIGIRKIHRAEELWPVLEQLGDMQSHHLLEQFVPGDVFHVDGVVTDGTVRFAETHQYAQPPFDTMHGGGIFCSRTMERGGEDEQALREQLDALVTAVGLEDAVVHAEFIRARDGGAFHFLEIAARVGGANIADMVEAASGVNLWREWANLEIALAQDVPWEVPETRQRHAGVVISLARQEWPDTSSYDDPEIVWRMKKKSHVGLIVAADDAARVRSLTDGYMHRFRDDFMASLPAPEKATN